MFCINKKDLGYIVTKYDDKFLITPDIHTSTSVFWRYDFSDIRRDDKIIDLGANIGGFAIAASHKVCKYPVMAIEPLRYKYLVNNININNSFVTPFHGGIYLPFGSDEGDGKTPSFREGIKSPLIVMFRSCLPLTIVCYQ